MKAIGKFYQNRIVNYLSTFFPIMVVVNHFTNSWVIPVIVFLVYQWISMFSMIDIPLNILFSILGCVWVLSDGYYGWMIVLYMVFVVPKLILLFLAFATTNK